MLLTSEKTMQKLFVLIFCVLFSFMFYTQAQAASRVAVVDWRAALLASDQGSNFRQSIEKQLGKDQKKLVQMKQSLVALQEQIKKDKDTLSEDRLEQMTDRFGKELNAYEQLSAQVSQKRLQMEEAFIKSAEPKIVEAITAISKQKKFDLVLDRQAALHVGAGLDITEALKQKLNQ